MSGSMADHKCKCVLCSKSLLANERYVDRIKTDTLTPLRMKVLTEGQNFIKHRRHMLYIIDFPNPVGRLINTSLPSKGCNYSLIAW